jgi:hypothetical protein
MPKKVLVLYYTQTGQLYDIVSSVITSLKAGGDVEIFLEELKPDPPFPFPWSSSAFFQAFPESVKGIPCLLKPTKIPPEKSFDLIIIAYQPWYLSPSVPFHAFFQQESTRHMISGKPVITLIGCRNMWVMAQETIKQYIKEANGNLVGNIVLRDRAPNLLSVVTIIRWMMKNKKERYLKIFPPAGVSKSDILDAQRFGTIIRHFLLHGQFDQLQSELVHAGAVEVQPELVLLEKRGKMLFRLWAEFILKKGSYGSPSRHFRLVLFKYYLLTVLYLVSPFATLLFYLTKPFRNKSIQNQILYYQELN